MNQPITLDDDRAMTSFFERYLTVWVGRLPVPWQVMLLLVKICLATRGWFPRETA